ncbi:MAG: ABC transporter permease [Pseudorhodoplanes sp.]
MSRSVGTADAGILIKLSLTTQLLSGLRRLARSHLAMAGLIIVILMTGMGIFAPLVAPYDPNAIDYRSLLAAPSSRHLLGTDDLGRDILSRVIFGARVSLGVSLSSVFVSAVIGTILGLAAGYLGGVVDEVMMRILDSVMALPSLVLALTIATVLGPGFVNAIIAITVVLLPIFARIVRGQVLSVKRNEYVLAAISIGVPRALLVFRHILPNVLNPVIVQAALGVGYAIILESSLSFIGLGAQPPTATWGSMVQIGFQYFELAPWFVFAPAAIIFVTVLGSLMLGDGLQDFLDPASHAD